MIKILSLSLILLFYAGGCDMNAEAVNTQNKDNIQESDARNSIKEKIFAHAEKNFSLDKSQAELKEITSLDLPNGVTAYYLEKKGTYGSEYYNYLVYKNELYCSKTDGDFSKLLKDFDVLKNKNLSAKQFWTVFQKLEFKDGEAMLIDERLIASPSEFFKPMVNKLSPPKLNYNENGAEFVSFTANSNDRFVEKHTVTVSSDYNVKVDSEKVN